jgi:hypothetical protein
MPVERLSHPSDGTSAKLCALSDFEFRVWHQVRLCANDLGVMLDSPAPLMAENRVLEQRKAPAVSKALRRLVDLGLLVRFEHQGVRFVCSPLWQDYQRVRYPRASHLPIPTGEALAACSVKTRELFQKYSRDVAEEFQKNPEPPAHERAGNANANAVADLDRGERERGPGRRATLMPPPPKNAVFAGKFVVPDFLDAEFERKSGRSYEQRQAWYRALDAEWRDRPIGEDDLKFLRARFAEWVGVTPQRASAPRPEPVHATWRERCSHRPPCSTPVQCQRLLIAAESSPTGVPA